ncbi:adenosine deaminase-like [Pollicipes pollicipes]|uniref:adenosine deaminase-like n=1 Tax=Pollicipes pollicipes TaxID=41117 RepID=UPI00188494D8|nr:adenosine deaminase-like [Pollicipes pollicipes]
MNVTEVISPTVKCRVHLHVHLDGAVRPSTVWELSRQKKLLLPGNGSLKDLEEALQIHSPRDLAHFLEKFRWISPAIVGDLAAIERIAYEFVEDEARQAVLYTEARLSPHLLVGPGGQITARQVTEAVMRGMARGERQFGVTARLLLSCIRGMTENYDDTLDMCTEFRGQVVGIDIAGDEASAVEVDGSVNAGLLRAEVRTFQEAARRGIHRTVHASEAGTASMVQLAIDEMQAERIGHGYYVLEDEELYRRCVSQGVHFECCPSSSFLTGAVPLTETRHPVQRFCQDGASFSANLDDPAITQRSLEDEYALLRRMGFNEANIATMNFNAAKACFLPEEEKRDLLQKLRQAYGVPDCD